MEQSLSLFIELHELKCNLEENADESCNIELENDMGPFFECSFCCFKVVLGVYRYGASVVLKNGWVQMDPSPCAQTGVKIA